MSRSERLDIIVGAKDRASGTLKGIGMQVAALSAAFIGLRQVGNFFKSAIDGALETERVYKDLAFAVESHIGPWKDYEDQIRSFTGSMQKMTGVSDELVAEGFQKLINYSGDMDVALRGVKAAMDLAAGDSSVSLQTAFDLIGKASVGYTSTLSRYGIILDESIPKSEKFNLALQQIEARFGGAAQNQMKTMVGQMSRLSEAYGDWKEELGKIVTTNQELRAVAASFAAFFEAINAKFKEQTAVFGDWLAVLRTAFENAANIVQAGTSLIEALLSGNLGAISAATTGFMLSAEAAVNSFYESVSNAFSSTATGFTNLFDAFLAGNAEWVRVGSESANAVADAHEEAVRRRMTAEEQMEANTKAIMDRSLLHVTKYTKGTERLLNNVVTTSGQSTQKMKDQVSDFARFGESQISLFSNRLVDQMWEGSVQLKDIFSHMAKDFITYFIDAAMKAVVFSFVPKLLGILGGLFDTPANDRMAMVQGQHFAQYFLAGMGGTLGVGASSVMSQSLIGSYRDAINALRQEGLISPGQRVTDYVRNNGPVSIPNSGATYNINFSGPVTSEEFVRSTIIPQFELAINEGGSLVPVNDQNITGG